MVMIMMIIMEEYNRPTDGDDSNVSYCENDDDGNDVDDVVIAHFRYSG